MKYNTPYADLIPPLAKEEFDALEADIKDHGVLHDVLVDEENNVLDGHNRLKIDKNAPVKVVDWLKTDSEKRAFVFAFGNRRRNLSPDQKRELRAQMQKTAKALREEDAKKWTQAALAKIFGVDQKTVSRWFETTTNNRQTPKSGKTKPKPTKPDARVKLSEKAVEQAAERVEAGETQAQVAADLGVSQQTVSSAVKKVKKKREKEQEERREASHQEREGVTSAAPGS